MSSEARHFAKLFRVELDDLIDEIGLLVDRMENRYERGELTEYVHLENAAFYKRVSDSLQKFAGIVDGIDTSIYKCMADIETDLLAKSRDFTIKLEDPEAVHILLKRKLDKVKKFISSDECATAF